MRLAGKSGSTLPSPRFFDFVLSMISPLISVIVIFRSPALEPVCAVLLEQRDKQSSHFA